AVGGRAPGAALCDKMGDATHAKRHRAAANAPAASTKSESLLAQLSRAHSKARTAEEKLDAAAHADVLRDELEQTESEHGELDILDADKLPNLLNLSAIGIFEMDELEYELTPGISSLVASSLKDWKAKVDPLRADHEAHLKRPAAKR
ncbi:unnamed protein product, partial [Prorocentrum cordatum]